MKISRRLTSTCVAFACAAALFCSAAPAEGADKPLKIAVVNFKTCVEKSKLGQKEQASFEAIKKQMETVLEEKEKNLTDIAAKFNDIDYLDSLSPEAEADLKRQFRTLNQEFSQQQNQFYQTLSQTNVKVVQKLTDTVAQLSKEVAKLQQIDLVLNDDGCFYCSDTLDISNLIVEAMDKAFEKEAKESKPGAPAPIK